MSKKSKTKEQLDKEQALFEEEMALCEDCCKLGEEIREKLGQDALKPLAELFDKEVVNAKPLSEGGLLPVYKKIKAMALSILNHSAE